jgi:hypothetical protein
MLVEEAEKLYTKLVKDLTNRVVSDMVFSNNNNNNSNQSSYCYHPRHRKATRKKTKARKLRLKLKLAPNFLYLRSEKLIIIIIPCKQMHYVIYHTITYKTQ